MDPAPPTFSASSATVAASFVASPSSSSGSPRGSWMSTAHSSASSRRSPPHLPPLPNRLSSLTAASGPGSGSSSGLRPHVPLPSPAAGGWGRWGTGLRTEDMYKEICAIRRSSAEYLTQLEAVAAEAKAKRAAGTLDPMPPQKLRHRVRLSPYNMPSMFHSQARWSQTTASLLPPLPREGFSSGYTPSSSWQQRRQAWPPSSSSNPSLSDLLGRRGNGRAPWLPLPQYARPSSSISARLDLMPNGNISAGHSPSFPQLQKAWPSSTTSQSQLPHLPGASFSGYAPSTPQQQNQEALPSSPSPMFAQLPSPTPSHHHQHGPAWSSAGPATFIAGSSSWSADPSPSWSTNMTSGTGFVQPVSSSEQYKLPPLPPSLQQKPLLPVKQEPMDSSNHLEPELICLDNDDTTDHDLDTLLASLESCPGLMASLDSSLGLEGLPPLLDSSSASRNMQQLQMGGNGDGLMVSSWGATESSGQCLSPMPEQVVSSFSMMSIDASSSAGGRSKAWNCQSTMPVSQQHVQHQGEAFASWSSDQSSSHWEPSPLTGDTPQQFMHQASASELPPLPPSLHDMSGTLPVGGSTSSSARDVLQYGKGIETIIWNIAASTAGSSDKNPEAMQRDPTSGCNSSGRCKMPWECHGALMSMENLITASKLMLGGMESQRVPPRPSPSPVAGASSSVSRTRADGGLFTDAELEKIMSDKHLKELVITDPKRVKRILHNRECTAKLSAQRKKCIRNLERQSEALKMDNSMLSSQVSSKQAKFVEPTNQKTDVGMTLQQPEVKAKMNEDTAEALRAEIERLKRADLSELYSKWRAHPSDEDQQLYTGP